MNNEAMFSRNYGYITEDVQAKIKNVKLLIAGCGLGSYLAECLVRMGCHHLTLVDFDTIEIHNLNRQDFTFADIGGLKTEKLKNRLLAINPYATIKAINEPISEINAKELVNQVDIVIDTIDFLSLPSILAMYEQCYLQKKTVISSLSAGWGAVAFYIPASEQTKNWCREIFGIPDYESAENKYLYYFGKLIEKIAPKLPLEVSENLMLIMNKMIENKPCPASQLSAGSFASASLCATLLHRALSEQSITHVPYAMVINMNEVAEQKSLELKSSG